MLVLHERNAEYDSVDTDALVGTCRLAARRCDNRKGLCEGRLLAARQLVML